MQITSQGLLSGLVAMVAYGVAVRSLGGTQAAAFTALTPVLAMIGGAMLLGERIGPFEIVAAVITAVGVAFSTGILSPRKA
ncbi:EamA-like transporter family protein [compost metagenome]